MSCPDTATTPFLFVPVVEGHGEVRALPILLRRLAERIAPGQPVKVLNPARVGAGSLLASGGLERYVDLAARHITARGAVLVLLDCDWKSDACPAKEAPVLLGRAKAARGDVPVSVVLANREYEAWFLAAAVSLRGKHRLPEDLEPPPDPEAVRDAKGWLTKWMRGGKYSPTVEQAKLTAAMDLDAARAAPSFDKLYREVARMLGVPVEKPPPE